MDESSPSPSQDAAQGALHFCPVCQTAIQLGEECGACPECNAVYHSECWQENGGCAIYGCKHVPATEGRKAMEIPVSYWGQEQKPCPVCGQQIQAAALRCRFCGTMFSSAQPVGQEQHKRELGEKLREPKLRRTVLILFVLSVLTFTAPIAAVVNWIWRAYNRDAVSKLPSFFPALSLIGLFIAVGQTVIVAVMAALFFFHHSQ